LGLACAPGNGSYVDELGLDELELDELGGAYGVLHVSRALPDLESLSVVCRRLLSYRMVLRNKTKSVEETPNQERQLIPVAAGLIFPPAVPCLCIHFKFAQHVSNSAQGSPGHQFEVCQHYHSP
jgi:hypothetical protein